MFLEQIWVEKKNSWTCTLLVIGEYQVPHGLNTVELAMYCKTYEDWWLVVWTIYVCDGDDDHHEKDHHATCGVQVINWRFDMHSSIFKSWKLECHFYFFSLFSIHNCKHYYVLLYHVCHRQTSVHKDSSFRMEYVHRNEICLQTHSNLQI